MFNGVDLVGWLARAKQYFKLNDMWPDLKVLIALICMEEGALHWLRQRVPNLTWKHFSSELLHLYSPDTLLSPFEFLAAMKQIELVDAYIDDFLM